MRKNDWVQFKLREELVEGMVIKGGKKITVAFGHDMGGYKTVQGAPVMFRKIKQVKLDDSGIMNGYELKCYKEAGGEETVRFEAKLYKDGIYIALVSNGGYGGCNEYSHVTTHEDVAKYYEDVKQWAIHYGDEDPFEPENNWINWVTTGKHIGQTAKMYWDDHKAYMKKPW
jgi:uncharacterized protein YxeA